MALAFFDTSALVRRYDPAEPGASRVRVFCASGQGHSILVARLATLEIASALSRKVREGALLGAHRDRVWRLFWLHCRDQYQVLSLEEQAYEYAEGLVFRYPLRAADALHLACAVLVARRLPRVPLQFWTADRQQAAAAHSEGLAIQLVS